jgi:hypothetical protein
VALRDKLAKRAAELGAAAADAAVTRAQHAGARYRGIRAVFKDDERPVTIENVVTALVVAVRTDEFEEDRSARDVFKTARSRRRRLGLLSFGAGPLAGVATHIVDLYCETATLCDLADLHSIQLAEHDVAAHMLVLWGVLDSLDDAKAVMTGTGRHTLASIIGERVRDGAAERLPEKLTKRTAIAALADARHLLSDARKTAGTASVGGVVFTGHRTKQLIKKAELQLGVRKGSIAVGRTSVRSVEAGPALPAPASGGADERKAMSASSYLNFFGDAGIADRRDEERCGRYIDAAMAQEDFDLDEILGVGERGTGSQPDLYVIAGRAIVLVSEIGTFNKQIKVRRVSPIAAIAKLSGTQEGFKGDEIAIAAYDSKGAVLFKIVWQLGGPDWVETLMRRQRQHLFEVISVAMDRAFDAPARPSISSASSKASAIADWAADVVGAAGVEVTRERVDEHANMAVASIRMLGFLRLGAPYGIDDLGKFFPSGEMPAGTPIETFDDLYRHVVELVGNAPLVDREIDRYLDEAWGEFVRGCCETYG